MLDNFTIQYNGKRLSLKRPQIMAIINVTPDSFSDGGRFTNHNNGYRHKNDLDQILYHAEHCLESGATILDIGGESTRPNATPLPSQEELDRVIPVIEMLRARFDCWLSIDTYKTEVMSESITAGIDLINDISALQDQGAIELVALHQIPACLMHMKGTPQTMQIAPHYNNLFDEVIHFFTQRLKSCYQLGIKKEQLLLDPGFGFGKTDEHNYQLLANLSLLNNLNLPLLIGLSRKGMIFRATGQTSTDCVIGSVTGAAIAALHGAKIIRVHDVKETMEALKIINATIAQQESRPISY